MKAMRALVKAEAAEGLRLEEVAEPEIGINDVLIRVHKTGICGTDLHIYEWDDWAQKTIPVPMVSATSSWARSSAFGSNVSDFARRRPRQRRGPRRLRPCRNCMAGRRHLCAHSIGLGVNRPGAFAEPSSLPMTNIWHHWPGVDEDVAAIFDPFGNAVHTALSFPVLGEDVLVPARGRSAAWPSRSSATRAPAMSSSPTSTRTGWSSPAGWAPRSPSTRASATSPTCSASSG